MRLLTELGIHKRKTLRKEVGLSTKKKRERKHADDKDKKEETKLSFKKKGQILKSSFFLL